MEKKELIKDKTVKKKIKNKHDKFYCKRCVVWGGGFADQHSQRVVETLYTSTYTGSL